MKLQGKRLIFQTITCSILFLLLNSPSVHARGGGTHGGVGSREDAATEAARTAPERGRDNLNNPNDPNLLVNPYGNEVVVPETVVVPDTTTTTTTTTSTSSPNAPVTPTTPAPSALPTNVRPVQGQPAAPQSNQDPADTFKKIPAN